MSDAMAGDFRAWNDYLYPNGVLKNKLRIQDARELREVEYRIADFRLQELHVKPLPGNFDLEHLQRIHKHLFQDVYAWAGELRLVDIYKGGTAFAFVAEIPDAARNFEQQLRRDDFLQHLPKHQFVDKLAAHYADLNWIHPFREGNGRSTRAFVDLLAKQAGYTLDQERIDNRQGQFNEACRLSAATGAGRDLSAIRTIFEKAVRPTRAVSFEQEPLAVAVAQHPELDGAAAVFRACIVEAGRQSEVATVRQQLIAQAKDRLVQRLDRGEIPTAPERNSNLPIRER